MITNLEISNIALISHLSLSFDKGLTVLSGETGSGKSIIIDSLSFVLGERADKTMIKHGEQSASVEVTFALDEDSSTHSVMEQLGFARDDTVVISRTMTLQGKNECRVNGKNCSASMLKTISSTLVDIFGQSQHLNMLRVDKHIDVIDGFADFGTLMDQLKVLYKQYRDIRHQLQEIGGSDAERERQLDILQFQIKELQSANLTVEEEQHLEAEHRRIVNIERIATALSTAQQHLSSGEPSAISSIAIAGSSLTSASKYDEQLSALADRLSSIKLEATDIADSIESMIAQTNYNVNEVDRVESRLETIRNIKRKYGGSVEEALAFLERTMCSYDKLSNAAELYEKLTIQQDAVTSQMYQLCHEISTIRKSTAQSFSTSIMQQLSDLGMKGTTFVVDFQQRPTLEEYRNAISPNGYDKVEFLLSANVGEPVKPLVKVISGGEMSRFMLAVKNVTAAIENIPTMVFDEIDTGISGKIAEMVAQKLVKVSKSYQCIVITHLPVIVAMADNNLLISKSEVDGRTVSTVKVLTDTSQKAEEVARLMGGVGQHSIVNALETISHCEIYKANQNNKM